MCYLNKLLFFWLELEFYYSVQFIIIESLHTFLLHNQSLQSFFSICYYVRAFILIVINTLSFLIILISPSMYIISACFFRDGILLDIIHYFQKYCVFDIY